MGFSKSPSKTLTTRFPCHLIHFVDFLFLFTFSSTRKDENTLSLSSLSLRWLESSPATPYIWIIGMENNCYHRRVDSMAVVAASPSGLVGKTTLLLENSWYLLNLYIEVLDLKHHRRVDLSPFSQHELEKYRSRKVQLCTRSLWKLKKRLGHSFVVSDMLGEGNIYQRIFCLSIVTFSEVQV